MEGRDERLEGATWGGKRLRKSHLVLNCSFDRGFAHYNAKANREAGEATAAKKHLLPNAQRQTHLISFWSNKKSKSGKQILSLVRLYNVTAAKLCCLRGDQTHGDASWWKSEKGALAWECVPCLQGACQHWWELNLCEVVSKPMGGGRTIGEKGYAGWFHSGKDNGATTFDSKLFKGIFVSLFANPNRITDINGQT